VADELLENIAVPIEIWPFPNGIGWIPLLIFKGVASRPWSCPGGDCDLRGSPSATVYLFLGVGLTLDCLFCCCRPFEDEGDGALRLLGLVPPLADKFIEEVLGEPGFRPRLRFGLEELGDTLCWIEFRFTAEVVTLEDVEEDGRAEKDLLVLELPEAGGELGGENEVFGLV